jgi:hypothetical protein
MRNIASRSAFAAALCTGVAMVGASMYGLVGVDADLQRSTAAVRELERPVHVSYERPALRVAHRRDCPQPRPRV